MPESAELIDDQDKTEHSEKLNEFFALIHVHCESKWGDLNATAFSGKDPSEDLSKTEVIANNFKEQTYKTNSNKSPGLDITQQF